MHGQGWLPVAVAAAVAAVVTTVLPAAAWGRVSLPSAVGCGTEGFDDHCERWVTVYEHPESGAQESYQFPADLAVAPGGDRVFAAAYRTSDLFTSDGASRWAVLALDAATGEISWETRVGDPTRRSIPTAVTVSPDGAAVYVTGHSRSNFSSGDAQIVTAAFDAAGGEQLWARTYSQDAGPAYGIDLGAAPAGHTVFVTGSSATETGGDIVVLGLDATTGATRFETRYSGDTADSDTHPVELAVDPDGTRVYIAGTGSGPGEYNVDYVTVAVDVACPGRRDGPAAPGAPDGPPPGSCGPTVGDIAWTARYDGLGASAPDRVGGLAVDPAGGAVYVTGNSHTDDDGPPFSGGLEFATVAYDTATGNHLWEDRRPWDGYDDGFPNAVVAADGRVTVTGQISQRQGEMHAGTVSYDAATGTELWATRLQTPGHDDELTLGAGLAPDGQTVYVTGVSSNTTTAVAFGGGSRVADQVTVAYDATTGTRSWTARHNATGYGSDKGEEVAVGPDGTVYVLGAVTRNVEADSNFYDTAVSAYPGG